MRSLFLLVPIITLFACNKSEFCIQPSAVGMILDFKTYDSELNLVDTALINASVYNTDATDPFEENEDGLTRVTVPLRSTDTEQIYIVAQDVMRDTIIIKYKPIETFISNGCGYQTYFELESIRYSTNSIDSVKINNPLVNEDASKYHLEVIY